MKNIVFFDIDGTLVSEDEERAIPESAKKAIAAARANGHLMYINTGRPIMHVEQKIIDVGFDGFICGCGTYVQCGDKVLFRYTPDKSVCDATARLIRECDIMPLYERYDTFFIDTALRENAKLHNLKEWIKKKNAPINTAVDTPEFSFDKFVAWYDEKSDIDGFKSRLDSSLDYIDRGNGFCEIVQKKYSKGTGIDMVLEYENIPRERTFAIGDSMNDLPMLRAVQCSIAMGNGRAVHKYVSFVTKDLYDDGIEFALNHFGMI